VGLEQGREGKKGAQGAYKKTKMDRRTGRKKKKRKPNNLGKGHQKRDLNRWEVAVEEKKLGVVIGPGKETSVNPVWKDRAQSTGTGDPWRQ